MSAENGLQHIAFILDGNRRWATEQGLPKIEGHTKGFENAQTIIKACIRKDIPYITMYAWSTENHKNREEQERTHIFKIIEQFRTMTELFHTHEIRFATIGDITALPISTKATLDWLKKETASHTKGQLTLALNYGGRDEITRAVQKIVAKGIASKDITEKTLTEHLDTSGTPDPDLMVRTGKGNIRLSNFLPWQLAYAELYFPGVYWPAFDEAELDKAITFFENTKRNFGK